MADLTSQNGHPDAVKREALKEQALALRVVRASYRTIAKELGISKTYAHLLVIEALEEHRGHNEQQATELRALEVALCDEMTLKLWPKADALGTLAELSPRTADTIIRIMERRARLLGLDAPQRWEGSGPNGGPIPISAGVLDLTKLSLVELRQLEAIHQKASMALPAGKIEAEVSPAPENPDA